MAFVSLKSESFPDRFIRHKNFLGFLDPIVTDVDKRDASFELVPGFADQGAVSIRSLWLPDQYLRHQNWRIKLTKAGDPFFNSDATFWKVEPGLTGTLGSISLRSYVDPNKYLRHRNFELWVETDDGSDLFKRDATFRAVNPLAPTADAQPPITTWQDVQKAAGMAIQAIPIPPPEAQVKPSETPMSDAMGVTQAMNGKPPVTAAVQALPQGFVQAAGGPSAPTTMGSLIGVGLGGAARGTGPLPGPLGVAAREIFGSNRVPHPRHVPTVRLILEVHPRFLAALERTGTVLCSRLLGLRMRELGDLRAGFLDLAAITEEDQFRAGLLTMLRELMNRVAVGLSPGMTPPFSVIPQAMPPMVMPAMPVMPSPMNIMSQPVAKPPPSASFIQQVQQAQAAMAKAAPLIVGSAAGQPPIAATPVKSAAIPQTVTPVKAATPMTVVPVGMAQAVTSTPKATQVSQQEAASWGVSF